MSVTKGLFALRAVAVATALIGVSWSAQADIVNFTGTSYGPAPTATVTYAGATPYTNTSLGAGAFGGGSYVNTTSGSNYSFLGGPVSTFCVELFQTLLSGVAGYSVVDPLVSGAYGTGAVGPNSWGSAIRTAGISNSIDKLMTFVPFVASGLNIAESSALQLAIWEVIYDSDADGIYTIVVGQDLSGGLFTATGFSNPGVAALTTGYLTGFASRTATQHFLVATHATRQDVLVVPEPSSPLLVAVALTSLALARRSALG